MVCAKRHKYRLFMSKAMCGGVQNHAEERGEVLKTVWPCVGKCAKACGSGLGKWFRTLTPVGASRAGPRGATLPRQGGMGKRAAGRGYKRAVDSAGIAPGSVFEPRPSAGRARGRVFRWRRGGSRRVGGADSGGRIVSPTENMQAAEGLIWIWRACQPGACMWAGAGKHHEAG